MTDSPVIRFENVSFRYHAAIPLLEGVSFKIKAGESVALLGNNGAGKSTLAKLADAILKPDSGRILISGFDTAEPDNLFEARRRIGYVFQDPDDQIVATLVKDDVAFGPANLGLSTQEVWARVDTSLARVGMSEYKDADVNSLSGGQKQRVAIAGALAMEPDILLLDEPTSMLDEESRDELLRALEELKTGGMAVLMVTHDIVAASAADRTLLLKDGSIHDILDISAFEEPLALARSEVRMLTSVSVPDDSLDDLAADPYSCIRESNTADLKSSHLANDVVIEMDGVSFTYDDDDSTRNESKKTFLLEDINLEVRQGELLAITGPNGSGKSTLIRMVNGLSTPTSGTVNVFGESTSSKAGRNHARRHVGVCFQYPERQFFAPTVFADVAAGPTNQGLAKDKVDSRVRQALEDVGLDPEAISNRNPFMLSGGEQRRVAIAGFLAMRPDVLVLDEPCANLDIPTHAELLRLIAELNSNGMTIVIVSHDAADVDALAHRSLRLSSGKICESSQIKS